MDVALAKEIFSLVGDAVEVDEIFVDAITAISGSGPAYIFYFIEALIEAGISIGLDKETAKRLAFKTASGSAELLLAGKEEPQALRAKVTSKGGTTEAAVKVFDSKKLKDIVREAVKAASDRSKELSKG
jgi:pyrroline-5-carboxylate reductase